MIMGGGGDTERLIQEAEKIREDLLRLAGSVGAWVDQLSAQSDVLRNDRTVREGMDCDDPTGAGQGGDPDQRSHPAEPGSGGAGA